MPPLSNQADSFTNVSVPVIGVHQSPLLQKFGTPRQPNLVKLPTKIVMLPPYDVPTAFVGIEQHSHLWITWQFHQNKPQANFHPMVRPPRLGGNEKVGVFATRSMYRPSQLGLSVVALNKVELVSGKVVLHILGADMVDGTPIIDIKPYLTYSDCVDNATSGFADSKPTLRLVTIGEQAKQQFNKLVACDLIQQQDIGYICELIAQDPRPAYRQHELNTLFKMCYKNLDVAFCMQTEDNLQIQAVECLVTG